MGLGGTEIALIVGLALLIFGPSQIPKLFKGLGEAVREMRSAAKEISDDEPQEKPKPPADVKK